MSDEAYALLAPPIRRILWDMRWQALRPIQVQAIHEIAEREGDLIISAPTASGKTEAAFLPILSALFTQPARSVHRSADSH